MRQAIETAIVDAIAQQLSVSPSEIQLETKLDDLGISSLDAITIVYDIEEQFGIEAPDDALQHMESVGDIIRGLESVLAAKQ